MLDQQLRITPTAQVIESPPRRQPSPADPCAMVIFGAGGDLTKRLLTPALYNLSRTKVLPENFAFIGVDHGEGTAESLRNHLHDMLENFVGKVAAEFDVDKIDEAAWKRLAEKISYVQGDFTSPELYEKIRVALAEAEKVNGTQSNVIFYLAVADRFFGTVVEQLAKAKLTDQNEDEDGKPRFWRRVVIEKPFGHSLESARALNASILRTLHEDQIFRIDHFLGKDTVQSIMAFRFANGLFEPIWNRDRIDHVQITAAETVGVEDRGRFYEATGALRDMVPNHILTLLSMVAMEPPTGFDAAAIRSKKTDVLAAMPAIKPTQAVRGQYGAGTVLDKTVKAYRQSPMWRRNQTLRPMSRCDLRSTIGAGPACLSMSVLANTCRCEILRLRFVSSKRPTRRSRARPSILCGPTGWCYALRRTRGYLCSLRSSALDQWCSWPPSRWTSTTMTGFQRNLMLDTRRFFMM